jgi:hypothetical protein
VPEPCCYFAGPERIAFVGQMGSMLT